MSVSCLHAVYLCVWVQVLDALGLEQPEFLSEGV